MVMPTTAANMARLRTRKARLRPMLRSAVPSPAEAPRAAGPAGFIRSPTTISNIVASAAKQAAAARKPLAPPARPETRIAMRCVAAATRAAAAAPKIILSPAIRDRPAPVAAACTDKAA